MRKQILILTALSSLFAGGCHTSSAFSPWNTITVTLEENEHFTAEEYSKTIQAGDEVSFSLTMEEGYQIKDDQDLTINEEENNITVTLEDVQFSKLIRLETEETGTKLTLNQNITAYAPEGHVNGNTPITSEEYRKDGYTLIGWKTDDGRSAGLGSRIDRESETNLIGEYVIWSDANQFDYQVKNDEITITGYTGNDSVVCIPEEIEGKTVTVIGEEAMVNTECSTLIIPGTVRRVESKAFENSSFTTVVLFDSVKDLAADAFLNCNNWKELRMNAGTDPVYSGTYYDTFPDKMDYLMSKENEKKIVLFSGSSTRFGFDSPMIEEAFDCAVCNMGVFAYTGALAQLDMITDFMQEGDILVHTPEFDAAKRQFCSDKKIDAVLFYMCESNYDLLRLLDLREYTDVNGALHTYLSERTKLSGKSYAQIPSMFDEDGNPVDTPSYNEEGDYIVYRPDSDEDTPIYNLPVEYTVSAFPKETYIDSYNEVCGKILSLGIHMVFDYAPRNRLALSESSTPEARSELESYLEENILIPIIGNMEDSLVSGKILYGTDNHLSTNGVQIRTEQFIENLKKYMEEEQ